MTPWRSVVAIAVLIIVLGSAAACGAAGTERPEEPAPRADAEAAGAAAEREARFWERLERARERFTEADVRFMTDMLSHHAQAIEMAELVPERSASTSIRTLARRIISAQRDDIEIMEQWLRERGQPVPELEAGRAGHAGHHASMPGMLTPEQMRALEEAEGAAFDRLFLTSMIEHHRGAVAMVRELFGTDGAGQDPTVFQFASEVQVEQRTEIARMERMLTEMAPG